MFKDSFFHPNEIYFFSPPTLLKEAQKFLRMLTDLFHLLHLSAEWKYVEGEKGPLKNPLEKYQFLEKDYFFVLLVQGQGQDQGQIEEQVHPKKSSSHFNFIDTRTSSLSLNTPTPPSPNPHCWGQIDLNPENSPPELLLAHSIADTIKRSLKTSPLRGLILAGGKSQRMQKSKISLSYQSDLQDQGEFCLNLLKPLCSSVHLSCRSEQVPEIKVLREKSHELAPLFDRIPGLGPMGGIFSAMLHDPKATWLILACDLPFVTNELLQDLINHWNPLKMATCFIDPQSGLPEPLCALYSPKIVPQLWQFLGLGITCPRKVLINSAVHSLPLPFPEALTNVNTPDEYQKAIQAKRSL